MATATVKKPCYVEKGASIKVKTKDVVNLGSEAKVGHAVNIELIGVITEVTKDREFIIRVDDMMRIVQW